MHQKVKVKTGRDFGSHILSEMTRDESTSCAYNGIPVLIYSLNIYPVAWTYSGEKEKKHIFVLNVLFLKLLLLSSQHISYAVMHYEIIAGQNYYNMNFIIKR